MSAHGFICVGGPLDGKRRAMPAGHTWLEVVEGPEPGRWPAYSTEYASASCGLVVKHHRYELREHDVHGAAWVYQP